MARIPLRPDDKSACKGLSEEERNLLTYYVIFGCTKDEAFLLFNSVRLVRSSKVAITKQASQFFSSKEAQAYLKAYRDTIERFLAGEKPQTEVQDTEQNASDRNKKRKLAAAQKIIDYVIKGANDIEAMDDPEAFVKLADKVGLFDDFEAQVEAPRRYLPQSCMQGCRYRLFCEENLNNGNMVDECQYCKYKAYANENGVVYDNMHLLDVPVDDGEKASE